MSFAQNSAVSVYGQMDLGFRYTTNIDGKKNNEMDLIAGGLYSNKIGVKGEEDLGQRTAAYFQLETGFYPDTGQLSSQGANKKEALLFGRTALLGLRGNYGKLSVGRQYNALNVIYQFQPIGDQFFVGGDNFFSGYRLSNSVVYQKDLGPFSLQFDYGLGEQAGSISNKSTVAGSIAYLEKPYKLVAAFGQTRAIDGATTGKSANTGGSWNITPQLEVYAGYLWQQESGASQRWRDMLFAGLNYESSGLWKFYGGYYYYRQSQCVGICTYLPSSANNVAGGLGTSNATGFSTGAGKGKAHVLALIGTYDLSKRTLLYAEMDTTLAQGGAARDDLFYNTAGASNDAQANRLRRTGVMTGMRHSF